MPASHACADRARSTARARDAAARRGAAAGPRDRSRSGPRCSPTRRRPSARRRRPSTATPSSAARAASRSRTRASRSSMASPWRWIRERSSRPETERVVDLALDEVMRRLTAGGPTGLGRPLQVIDIGTGSGAVAVALAVALRARRVPPRTCSSPRSSSPVPSTWRTPSSTRSGIACASMEGPARRWVPGRGRSSPPTCRMSVRTR